MSASKRFGYTIKNFLIYDSNVSYLMLMMRYSSPSHSFILLFAHAWACCIQLFAWKNLGYFYLNFSFSISKSKANQSFIFIKKKTHITDPQCLISPTHISSTTSTLNASWWWCRWGVTASLPLTHGFLHAGSEVTLDLFKEVIDDFLHVARLLQMDRDHVEDGIKPLLLHVGDRTTLHTLFHVPVVLLVVTNERTWRKSIQKYS